MPRIIGDMGATPPINRRDPLRQFDWILAITGSPLQQIVLELSITTAFLPNYSTEEIELPWRNSRTWVAGKANWEPGTIICRDFINPNTSVQIYQWMEQVYNPQTGVIGLTDSYKKKGSIYVLDTLGNTQREWELDGIWPTNVNYGQLDYAASDVIQLELTLRYDLAYLR